MREIKFRAWDKKYKQMYGPGDIRVALAFSDKDVEIMQYTGLKDKNGKEIYEGDVVRHKEWGYSNDKESIVYFIEGGFFPFADNEDNEPYPKPEESEVIGNRYENPERMEV